MSCQSAPRWRSPAGAAEVDWAACDLSEDDIKWLREQREQQSVAVDSLIELLTKEFND